MSGSPRFSDIRASGLVGCESGCKVEERAKRSCLLLVWAKEEGAERDSMAMEDVEGSEARDVDAILLPLAAEAAGPELPGSYESIDIPLSLLGAPTLLARDVCESPSAEADANAPPLRIVFLSCCLREWIEEDDELGTLANTRAGILAS